MSAAVTMTATAAPVDFAASALATSITSVCVGLGTAALAAAGVLQRRLTRERADYTKRVVELEFQLDEARRLARESRDVAAAERAGLVKELADCTGRVVELEFQLDEARRLTRDCRDAAAVERANLVKEHDAVEESLRADLAFARGQAREARLDVSRCRAWCDAADALIAVADSSGRFLDLNHCAATEFGYFPPSAANSSASASSGSGSASTPPVSQLSLLEVLHPEDRPSFLAYESSMFSAFQAYVNDPSRSTASSGGDGQSTGGGGGNLGGGCSPASSATSISSQALHWAGLPALRCRLRSHSIGRGNSTHNGGNRRHGRNTRFGSGLQWRNVLLSASPWINEANRSPSSGSAQGGASSVSGRDMGIVYVGMDITELCHERREVELLCEDILKVIQNANALIICLDSQGRVDEWNRQAEVFTGYTKAEAIGKNFVKLISEEISETAQAMLSLSLKGEGVSNYVFPIVTKGGFHRELLWSANARRDRDDRITGVCGVGQDITDLRSESKMLANYVRICGAAVWSLRGRIATGAVTECKTKEIEHLISQQAQMDICDPRMVLWRASFVSILRTMCQNFWMRRKGAQGNSSVITTPPSKPRDHGDQGFFGYEFCFEAPNGQVKWYKVEGHLIEESTHNGLFEVSGSMQEVTEMWIDKVMGDRRSSMWSRMCHMVFDATLLVDTQEYRVLNAWGEEKVFGRKLQSNHAVLQLIKAEDVVALKEAFNEVTFKGFERGRTLRLLRLEKAAAQNPSDDGETPSQCFLLAADPENPNECMMGIRMQASSEGVGSVLWDVSKPNPVLTLEDLAVLKSGLKRHRRPSRNLRHRQHPRSSDPHASARSLSSIPEDLFGESEEDVVSAADDGGFDTESCRSSSKSSNSSRSSAGSVSEVGVCNSSPRGSASDEPPAFLASLGVDRWQKRLPVKVRDEKATPVTGSSLAPAPALAAARRVLAKPVNNGPPMVKLRWNKQSFDLNFDEFSSVAELRTRINAWLELKEAVRPGQVMMLMGSRQESSPTGPPESQSTATQTTAAAGITPSAPDVPGSAKEGAANETATTAPPVPSSACPAAEAATKTALPTAADYNDTCTGSPGKPADTDVPVSGSAKEGAANETATTATPVPSSACPAAETTTKAALPTVAGYNDACTGSPSKPADTDVPPATANAGAAKPSAANESVTTATPVPSPACPPAEVGTEAALPAVADSNDVGTGCFGESADTDVPVPGSVVAIPAVSSDDCHGGSQKDDGGNGGVGDASKLNGAGRGTRTGAGTDNAEDGG
eukprot:TRINITY_DN4017_c0_g1_i1.p1 TRINITY_DN4017_c0_g1~~TRINITY_DN4017_c0_g1_i1.p1  ORF type:complete len:1276 (+),score=240.38 TRINITY_DN4017_c0_g1_i1:177-4004(+)